MPFTFNKCLQINKDVIFFSDTDSISEALRMVYVPVDDHSHCVHTYGIAVNDDVICIDSTGGKGTCNVSIGIICSPLHQISKYDSVLIGLANKIVSST